MQNQDEKKLILSIIRLLILYTLNDFYTCLKHANIPSQTGETRRSKTFGCSPFFFSVCVWVHSNELFVVVRFMSPVSMRLSPVSKEYFQRPQQKGYKECNRYKIANITLESFGLKIIDQGTDQSPKVMESDKMVSNPEDDKNNASDKPFCCKFCGSENYKKYGKKNDKQIYKCKDCNRKFVDNMFFERRKAEPKIICLTLDLYFKGVSLRKISDHLKQFHDIDVCFTTVFRWIERYIEIMDEYVSQFKPELGNIWQADEMMIQINGDWFYLWNVLDTRTRFHLASVISKQRRVMDACKVFQQAKKRSHGNKPEFIITDGLQSYNKAINKEFHAWRTGTKHIGNVGINRRKNKHLLWDNNKVERLHGTIRERNKTQRGLEKEDSVFINGHNVYYNFIRNHMALGGVTPAEKSGVDLNLGNNKWENLLIQSLKYHNGEKNE